MFNQGGKIDFLVVLALDLGTVPYVLICFVWGQQKDIFKCPSILQSKIKTVCISPDKCQCHDFFQQYDRRNLCSLKTWIYKVLMTTHTLLLGAIHGKSLLKAEFCRTNKKCIHFRQFFFFFAVASLEFCEACYLWDRILCDILFFPFIQWLLYADIFSFFRCCLFPPTLVSGTHFYRCLL